MSQHSIGTSPRRNYQASANSTRRSHLSRPPSPRNSVTSVCCSKTSTDYSWRMSFSAGVGEISFLPSRTTRTTALPRWAAHRDVEGDVEAQDTVIAEVMEKVEEEDF